ncbi:septum formation initiator [Allokutzneria sp. A3M-2-11 16]|uniref:septum formation initiator n=1 Tax=Allokutzneria sp. A3M-2-11 16 TaxID=2962043 RepID=UPI0020B659B4|nr:septum formation initiator [Allokutzneria sp. A3M-2-11 16]MCP3797774.1 septum formation initiator [Allokutzneria sp. A3M-2-11 16]
MTAPARSEPPTPRGQGAQQARDRAAEHAAQHRRSAAAERAYARRAQRTGAAAPERRTAPAPRAPFVLLVMGLLGTGIVASLWLSTAAATDTYKLEQTRREVRRSAEDVERLRREVSTLESPIELDRRARERGMVPAGDPARLQVKPDGSVDVVGDPKAAEKPRSSVRQHTPPAEQPPAPPAGQQPPAGGGG